MAFFGHLFLAEACHVHPAVPPHNTHTRRVLSAIAVVTLIALSACGSDEEAKLEPISEAQAARFLEQASFGPYAGRDFRLQSLGYSKWIDDQFTQTSNMPTHLQMVEAMAVTRGASKPDATDITSSWWTHAIKDNAQLRQRVVLHRLKSS